MHAGQPEQGEEQDGSHGVVGCQDATGVGHLHQLRVEVSKGELSSTQPALHPSEGWKP